jgi:hypothetical protein
MYVDNNKNTLRFSSSSKSAWHMRMYVCECVCMWFRSYASYTFGHRAYVHFVCMHTYTHTTHTFTWIYMFAYTHICIDTYLHTCTHPCIYAHRRAYRKQHRTYIHTYDHARMHAYTRTYIRANIHANHDLVERNTQNIHTIIRTCVHTQPYMHTYIPWFCRETRDRPKPAGVFVYIYIYIYIYKFMYVCV